MAQNGPFGTLFDLKIPPTKSIWVLFCVLSQEMRHINFFWGSKMGFLIGGQKVYVERVYVRWIQEGFKGGFL